LSFAFSSNIVRMQDLPANRMCTQGIDES
jgi:hypothetical protein